MKKQIKKLEELMAKKHPKCVQTDFLMSFLSKSGAKKKGNKRKEAKEN